MPTWDRLDEAFKGFVKQRCVVNSHASGDEADLLHAWTEYLRHRPGLCPKDPLEMSQETWPLLLQHANNERRFAHDLKIENGVVFGIALSSI